VRRGPEHTERAQARHRVAQRITRCDWSDFLRLAQLYGFVLHTGSGSRRRLTHPSGLVVTVHEPHPPKRPVHPEAVKALLRAVERVESE
jgi:predicted RNA binding protein YcfA (HicA-like mRNA interferase family)